MATSTKKYLSNSANYNHGTRMSQYKIKVKNPLGLIISIIGLIIILSKCNFS